MSTVIFGFSEKTGKGKPSGWKMRENRMRISGAIGCSHRSAIDKNLQNSAFTQSKTSVLLDFFTYLSKCWNFP